MLKAIFFTLACAILPAAAFAADQCQPLENGFLPCAEGKLTTGEPQQDQPLTVQNNPELLQNAQYFRGRGHGHRPPPPPHFRPPIYPRPVPPFYNPPFNRPFIPVQPQGAPFCYASQSVCNMTILGPPGMSCSCVWNGFIDNGVTGF